jgi:hypothetical protein
MEDFRLLKESEPQGNEGLTGAVPLFSKVADRAIFTQLDAAAAAWKVALCDCFEPLDITMLKSVEKRCVKFTGVAT